MSAQVAGQVGVRRGDPIAATEAEHWLRDYANSRDAALREWIILAYLGLADRIASRYRHGHRTTLEDLTQTARAGLIAAVDRYDPAKSPSFVPFAVACVVGELKRYLRDTSWRLHVPGRAKKPCCGCTGRPMSYARPWAARPPPASWPTTCT
jgi:RNA polymerase sigma-B factor